MSPNPENPSLDSGPQSGHQPTRFKRRIAAILSACLFASLAAGGQAQTAAGAEWTTPAGTLQGTRFSSLAGINSSNVGSLVEEFAFATGTKAATRASRWWWAARCTW